MADDVTPPADDSAPPPLPDRTPDEASDTDRPVLQEPTVFEPEVMEALPPEVRQMVLAMSTRVGPRPHPLADKITSDHITQVLGISEGDSKREREDAKESRGYALVYVLLFCALFVFVTVFLAKTNTALYEEILKLLVAFLGGVGSGFGAKSFLDRKKGGQ